MSGSEGSKYCAIRLNSFSEASWAVICRKSGAIILDAEGRLMTKMSEAQANTVAARLSARPRPLDASAGD